MHGIPPKVESGARSRTGTPLPYGRMADRRQPHIWYESCKVCYGVFFDAGEFTDFKEETLLDWFKGVIKGDRDTVCP